MTAPTLYATAIGVFPMVEYPLADLVRFWKPGSAEHGWAVETADIIGDDGLSFAALVHDVAVNGVRFPTEDEEPILLGDDGRVWGGHHRICAARICDVATVPVAFGGAA